jgi:hypothetical protein
MSWHYFKLETPRNYQISCAKGIDSLIDASATKPERAYWSHDRDREHRQWLHLLVWIGPICFDYASR